MNYEYPENIFTTNEKLGYIGERLVADYLGDPNGDSLSEDKYDSNKDLIINGKTVEVKTEIAYRKGRAFSVTSNQLRKCSGVDSLYFVTFGSSGCYYIYECTDREDFSYRNNYGKRMIDYPIDKMTLVKKQEDQIVSEMIDVSRANPDFLSDHWLNY